MPSLKSIARRLSDRAFGTAFDHALTRSRHAPHNSFLFYWNRGMGDVALCIVPLFARIRREAPDARITVITRDELKAPFELTDVDDVHVLPGLQRETRIDLADACAALGLDIDDFGTVFDYPDPNRWLEGRRHEFPPKLSWNRAWDAHADRLMPTPGNLIVIGAHVHSETAGYYGYVKDWPAAAWQALFTRFENVERVHWVLLGRAPEPRYDGANISDMRGRTDLAELLSIVKNRCRLLIAPDSGVLTMVYYLDVAFPIDVISLWSDRRQGILRQGCGSPNPLLRHIPLYGAHEDIRNLPVAAVEGAVRASLAAERGASNE
jgi:ADP-heptose:LPS heptosyltransferase